MMHYFYYRYAHCLSDGRLRPFFFLLRAKEEKQTTKTTTVRLQWSYEILSGTNYVNRQHFHAICW